MSNPEKNHHANYSIDGTDRWWQSPPLSRSLDKGLDYNYVNLTIDFGQDFHVAYIYIKMANSPRPGVWALEKSVDHGQTFQPWQYFADTPSDCSNIFATPTTKSIARDDDVICTTQYSKVLPLEGGEVSIFFFIAFLSLLYLVFRSVTNGYESSDPVTSDQFLFYDYKSGFM
jgi:laminin alpha 3/5